VNASAFAAVDPGVASDSLRDVYARLAASRPSSVRLLASRAAFHDLGTAADYLRTALTLARDEEVPLDRGPGCVVSPSATVQRTLLWDRVSVGDGAWLDHCIVADDVIVPPGARYDRAVITRDVVTAL
jgi:NDP-sugar pyrophosphorylase family protein